MITTCHILAAAMEYLQMESLNDQPSEDILPNASDVWAQPDGDRTEILNKLCGSIVDTYMPFTHNVRDTPELKEDKV